jgi:hypothetical protein
LGSQFEIAISSVRYCLKIRNQYAHCTWYDDYSGSLAFVNLEEGADSNQAVKDFQQLTIQHIDVSTLIRQEKYFEYSDSLLAWVNFEGRRIAGKNSRPPESQPKQLEHPPLHL